MRPVPGMLAAACAFAAMLAGGWWLSSRDEGSAMTSSAVTGVRDIDPPLAVAVSAGASAASIGARADSLRDTEVDGGVRVDARGRPQPDRELRRLFDYFLSRTGEQSPEAIRVALIAHLQPHLAADALATVLAWFDAYVALERDSVAAGHEARDMEAAVARVRSLRRERLGAELAQAWYGEEERAYDDALARRRLLADRSLDEATRARRVAELDARLDPQWQAERAQGLELDSAVRQSRAFEARRVDAATRYAEREALYGREAAQRLAQLDARKAQWQDRLRRYAAQRQRVLADTALSDSQRRQRMASLLQGFDANERRRVDALARNGLLPGP
ncbi:proteobacterial lipase chaperone family protein [Lysobacter antibioticus]|uniref:Lipase chaperone n=2 Tax=Lysobacter antibioticus TaxID=84531 RepID=A0A0S2F836_LYSAN|nr:proteobacterial lipase chaperone family protein [Lysobacter antibioticus]